VIIARRNVEKSKFRKSGSENPGSSWQSRQSHFLADACALDHRVNEIRRDIAQSFSLAVRPANRNFLHLSIRRQPKVHPADLSAKCNSRRRALHRTALRPGCHGYASAGRSFVALGSNQLEQNTVIRAFMMVASFPPGYVFWFLAGMVVLQLI
jgi:hypothetical protein